MLYLSDLYEVSALQLSDLSDVDNLDQYIHYFEYMKSEFRKFASLLTFPITIFYEPMYVDRAFRDCYYSFFASKHFQVSKNCQRITLFEGLFSLSDFYCNDTINILKSSIIGTIVIRPLKDGTWGQSLIDPKKLNQKTFFVRTTPYLHIINGIDFIINAYPFSSQDTEMMSCAETSIWTMLNYYGNRYPEYRTVLPSEIISEVDSTSKQRVLPTQGLDYLQKSNLLKRFGFSPRVYSREIYGDTETKRTFHYYVESGIPLTISLNKHSTVCIGHAKNNVPISSITPDSINGFSFVDSSDLHTEYVIIDDNQYPYKIETYDNFSLHDNSKQLVLFTVPLYKRIFLEANAAERIFNAIIRLLFENTTFKFIQDYWELLIHNKSEPIIKRIFLTSSRKYKAFRIRNAYNESESAYYLNLHFPKFIWVMELTTSTYYNSDDKKVLGEIVLDATASKYSNIESIISMRIGKIFTHRMPDDDINCLYKHLNIKKEISDFLKQYENNLIRGGTI